MRILDILNRPWAILQTKLETIQEIYARHAAGEKIDVEGLKLAAAGADDDEAGSYTVQNGVAVVPIDGVISKRMNLFTYFSGGTSTQVLQQMVADAMKDPAVHSIVLAVDSPGGEVDGTQVAANAIREAAKTKPVVALIDGLGASAAYWLASQASQVFITDDTTEVGSIGVVATHTDRSKANEMSGRKVTEVTAGKYKRIASSHAPLSVEGQQTIQDQVDHIYSIFVDAVASGRGVSVDTVLADMADGRIFIGQQAIDAGLVDGISSLDAIITQLNLDFVNQQQNPGAKRPANRIPGANMSFKVFATEAEYKAALDAEFERGKAAYSPSTADLQKIKNDATVAGATAERERIKSVESTPLASSHKDLISTLKFDGKSTSSDAAVAILAAEEKVRGNKVKELAEDAGSGVAASAADAAKEAEEKKNREAAAAGTKDEDPMVMSAKITNHIAEAAKAGRKVTYAQAAAEINRK
jgi:signal peptide peptidase SppA